MKEGETVLIHAGTGGVGTAAIQLTRMFKAIPLVTTSPQEKIEMAKKLGAEAGFDYKKDDFSEGALKLTQGMLDRFGGYEHWEERPSFLRPRYLPSNSMIVLYSTSFSVITFFLLLPLFCINRFF